MLLSLHNVLLGMMAAMFSEALILLLRKDRSLALLGQMAQESRP